MPTPTMTLSTRPSLSRFAGLLSGWAKGQDCPEEPDLDFKAEDPAGNEGYYDVKSPSSSYPRPLQDQAADIASKTNLYDEDTKVVIDLENIDPAQQESFKQMLLDKNIDMSKVIFVGQ
jgi:hypothetical protein